MVWTYCPNFDDFKAAQRLWRRQSRKRIASWVFFVRILPVVSLFAAAYLVYDMTARHFSLNPASAALLAGLATAGFSSAISYPVRVRRLYKQMKNGRADDEPIELELAGDQLISRVPGRSEGRFYRVAISQFAEDEKVGIFFVAKNRFLLVPKRALDAEGWQILRDWLGGKAAETSVERPV